MKVRNKLVSNTVYLFLDWFVLTLMGFLYWLIAGKTLLPEEYGIVSISTNLATLFSGLSLLGLNLSVMKLLPEYLSKKQSEKIISLISFSLKVIVSTNLIIALILILFSNSISSLLKVPLEAVWISSGILLACSLSFAFGSVIYGFQEMKNFFISDSLGKLTKVVVSTLLIFLGFRYFGPLIGFLLDWTLVALIRFKLSYPRFSSSSTMIDKREVMLNYAFPAFASFLAWTLFLNGQYVLLTILKNPEVTGIFTIAMLLTSIIATFPRILNQALFPIISSLSVDRNSKQRQSYLIQLVFRYGLFLALPIAAFLVIFSKPVILIFSRPEYLNASQLFPILVIGSLIYGLGNIFLSQLYAIGKTKINRNIVILTTTSFLILAIPLASILAGFGMALSYTISVAFLAIFSFFYIRKYLKVKLPFKGVIKCLIAVSISFSFLYITTAFTTGLLIGFPLVFMAGIIYFISLIPMRFYIREDILVLRFVASKSPFKKQILSLVRFLSKYT